MTPELQLKRNREIRDIYNKLSKKYRRAILVKFFEDNYFLGESRVHGILRQCDRKAVTQPSMAYTVAMKDDFAL